MNTEPAFFPIQSLSFDPELQIREKINEDTISLYAEQMTTEDDMQKFPPVEIYYDGAKYWLADGHHRRAAAEQAGHDKVWAIIKSGTRADALWGAILGNGKQGLALTRADKQRAIRLVIIQQPDQSNRSIADAVGCGKSTVDRIRDQVSQMGHLTTDEESATRVTGKDGKSYPAKLKTKHKNTISSEKPQEYDTDEESVGFETTDETIPFSTDEHYPPLSQPIPEKDSQFVQTVKLQNIPLNDPERLIACLFDLFDVKYREKLVLDLLVQMEIDDGKKTVQRVMSKLNKKFTA